MCFAACYACAKCYADCHFPVRAAPHHRPPRRRVQVCYKVGSYVCATYYRANPWTASFCTTLPSKLHMLDMPVCLHAGALSVAREARHAQ